MSEGDVYPPVVSFPPEILTDCRDRDYIESLVPEVAENVKGRRVKFEGEDDDLPPKAQ